MVRSCETARASKAARRGRTDTTVKPDQRAMYLPAFGLSCEMSFSAIGMNPPGLANVAPAATTAITGEDEILLILLMALAVRSGSRGRRCARTTYTRSKTPMTTSMIATHVGGSLELLDEAAAFPSTNAATTPITSVAATAPKKNQNPVRPGRSLRTSDSTLNVSVVGESIAANAVRPSSTSADVTAQPDR